MDLKQKEEKWRGEHLKKIEDWKDEEKTQVRLLDSFLRRSAFRVQLWKNKGLGKNSSKYPRQPQLITARAYVYLWWMPRYQ